MGKLSHLIEVVTVMCVFYTVLTNASPTMIPPELPEEPAAPPGYLLTMPQTLQGGAREQFCLTLHGLKDAVNMTLALTRQDTEDETEFTFTFSGGENQCRTFDVPTAAGTYDLSLLDENMDTLSESQVEVLSNNLITFVQTDKPIYKPGQTVKFRVLTMTRNLRPRIGKIDSIYIKDPNQFKVKKFNEFEPEGGMANLEFQLISDAKLGKWMIEVTVDGKRTVQSYEVAEYVLPRFEVTVEPPAYLLATSETFEGTVHAKYTYGKPVQGFLTLKVCSQPSHYGPVDLSCMTRLTKIDGSYKFSFNTSELRPSEPSYFRYRSHTITASVREDNTGVQVNTTVDGPVPSREPLKLEFSDDTNGYFKPGLPILGKLKASNPDGSPAAKERIEISARDYRNDLYFMKQFETDDKGEIHYSLCEGIMDNTTTLSVSARAMAYENLRQSSMLYTPTGYHNFKQWFSPSLSYIQIPANPTPLQCGQNFRLNVPFTHNGLKSEIDFNYQVMARGRIVHTGKTTATIADRPTDLEPELRSCLEVAEEPTPAPIPEEGPVETYFHEMAPPSPPGEDAGEGDRIALDPEPPMAEPPMIMGLSESVGMEDTEPVRRKRSMPMLPGGPREVEIERSENPSNDKANVELTIIVTPEMSPSFSVLLFYIRDDGETVADSMQFKVEPCFDNQVKMEFAEKKVLPGSQTSINLEAAAGSVCGIGVVDKSVNILGGDHQLTPEKVFEKLAEYSLSRRNSYSYYRSDNTYCKEKITEMEKKEENENEEEEGELPMPMLVDYWYRSPFVDAIEAFKQMGMLVLTNLELETRPCAREFPVYFASVDEISPRFQLASIDGRGPGSADVRTDFPETWLWDLVTVGPSGVADLTYKTPDTITEWVGNSLCMSESAGFGLSPLTRLTTFKPFFLAFNLPYNAVRGERIPITVTVYNYLEKCLHMKLMVDGRPGFKVHSSQSRQDTFCLCGGETFTRKYHIIPQDIGKLPIFAEAQVIPGQCGNSVMMDSEHVGMTDAVQRKVLVKAEGVTQRYTVGRYICPDSDRGVMGDEEIQLPLPEDIVPDSARGFVNVIGDIMGPALSNLDGLVRMPTGCGEQNMVGFTPNIYVLKYLTVAGKLTEIVEDKAMHYMEIGYQRELKYRHPDGSFSAFGPDGSKPGSTWLTAFVVKSFAEARPYIFIDEDDLQKSVEYLKSTQNPEDGDLQGCFFERGKVFSSYMQGGMGKNSSEAALSAYVLIALLEAGLSPEDSVAQSAINCINRELRSNPGLDVYSMALLSYANVLYSRESPMTSNIMARFYNMAANEDGVLYWKRRGDQPKPVNSWFYYSAPSAEVEMTSYGLLATLHFQPEGDAVARGQPIAYWLSNQQSAFGGFSSTQDTVLGLNALSEFAAFTYTKDSTDLQLNFRVSDGQAFGMTVTEENRLELQRRDFAMDTKEKNAKMQLDYSGNGCALVQTNVYYNKMPNKLGITDTKFNLRVSPRNYQHDRNRCDRRTIFITYGQRDTEQFSTGMTILSVRMVTGWTVIPESLEELKSRFSILGIERYEEANEEGVVNFYLDQLDTRTRRFGLDVEQDQEMKVTAPKAAEVQIYQYYEKDVTVIRSYNLKTTCGTKLSIPFDLPNDGIIRQQRVDLTEPVMVPSNFGGPREMAPICPVCDTEGIPDNFDEIICNSTAVYKAHAGRRKRFSLKIKANLRPRRKTRHQRLFANVVMDDRCQCPLLQAPLKMVLIVTQKSNLANRKLTVDSRTYVFNLTKEPTLERKARRAQRPCKMD